MGLISHKAPHFTAEAVDNLEFKTLSLKDFENEYVILLFYPLDFTFVCPTELWAFSDRIQEFEQKNCRVLAVSVDSKHSHLAWLKTPKNKGGVKGLNLTLISDINRELATSYDILTSEGVALRGMFIIDNEQIIRSAIINDLPIGRSVDEALRLLDAVQFHQAHGEVCPVNWKKGDQGMTTDSSGLHTYFSD
ncbi:MAG: peroxiredoxin [Myxococcota bacterium]|nr:peroxiredoxin [Myxococcota bacterium]MEC8381129.1 peroxiredoxin [Myxococcota bacterium]